MTKVPTPAEIARPNRKGFGNDPFGYGSLAWAKWAMAQTAAGFPIDPTVPPTNADLKSPVLWLAHAHAISVAAHALIKHEPTWDEMPVAVRGVCDCQYCAVALMLVGYSLEVSLKAMLIITHGIDTYTSMEGRNFHHELDKLASLIPALSEKDLVILRVLSHFVKWAGRYPDPGSGRDAHDKVIFEPSEKHQITARDVFDLAGRVMQHAQQLTNPG